MRAERLMALLFTLQQRRRATAAQLAGTLEVSERTIHRDVAALQAAGVPLWTEGGRHGGIRLTDGWRTRLDGLTGQEAAALLALGVPQALAQLGLSNAVAAGQAKLTATLPAQLREHVQYVAERFHLDAPGWFQSPDTTEALSAVATALWEQRRLRVRYRRGERLLERVLEPLGLVLKAGVWYLIANVPDDRHDWSVRTYRVARIVEAHPQSEHFERPADFRLADWWESSSASFERSLLRESIRLRVSRRGLRMLPLFTNRDAAAEAVAGVGPPDDAGWVQLELAVEGHDVALDQLIALGAEVEILEPEQLRADLAELGRRITTRNSPLPGEPPRQDHEAGNTPSKREINDHR